MKEATQQAFLAQAEFDGVRERFAVALQELDALGEPQSWMKESFGLTASELRSLLKVKPAQHEEDDPSRKKEGETPTPEVHEHHDQNNEMQ
ncbi:hypothetical protein NQ042_10510 [Corynebacterium phoceense]|nr:hypothetical protein [Corynebacterium phoceense]